MPARGAAFLLASVGLDLARRFRAALAPLRLEPRQFAVLRHIVWKEDQTQQMLCDQGSRDHPREVQRLVFVATHDAEARASSPDVRRAGEELLLVDADDAGSHVPRDPVCRRRGPIRGD
jgi:hypothetical protein